ncbi:MAG: cyclic nucleotide-binding domain-containing protein [Verrucomicrobia bacterium]|nr:cyclic nucleotide-binding domain-containing protein [Verrucomicrobiota bacterium]
MAVAVSPQVALLSSAKLRISRQLSRVQPEADAVILRAAGGPRRLVVSPVHADLLTEGFSGYTTVPDVLVRAIADHRCPPLREFYELVVQAHAAGILQTEPEVNGAPAAVRWPLRLPARPAAYAAAAVAAAGLVGLATALPHWRGPAGWADVVGGWLTACALLTLGQLLAACVVAGAGEVRAARIFWRTRFPHFQIDTSEAMLGGRACEVAVAALRAAPVLAGAALVAWEHPVWLAALCGGSLYVLAPFGNSAARQWLASRRRAPHYSIRANFLFEPVREDLWTRWTARCRLFYAEFGWAGFAWTVVWVAWGFEAFTRCMPATVATVTAWVQGVPPPGRVGAEILLLAALAFGLIVSAWAGLKHWLLQRRWARPLRGADAREANPAPLTGDRPDMLAQVPLFRDLDRESRAALAEAMEPVECARGDAVVREDEAGEDFFVLIEGELQVRKRRPGSRRSTTVGWLGPGDCFGEIALLENTTRTATIEASRPSRLLKLGRSSFEQLVLGRLGTARIREVLLHARFLGRLTFLAGWSFGQLVTFAQRCSTVRVDAGAVVLKHGEDNHWFYLIYDGAFEARQGQRVLRKLGLGDYFGEISLLEGSPASATIVATEEGRCLALPRRDFLELFAQDFRIGLRIEAQAGKRRGASVFASE